MRNGSSVTSARLEITSPLLDLGTCERALRLQQNDAGRGIHLQCREAAVFCSWELACPLVLSNPPLVGTARLGGDENRPCVLGPQPPGSCCAWHRSAALGACGTAKSGSDQRLRRVTTREQGAALARQALRADAFPAAPPGPGAGGLRGSGAVAARTPALEGNRLGQHRSLGLIAPGLPLGAAGWSRQPVAL